MRQLWFGKVYDEIFRGFNIGTNEAIHGSLLTMKELLDKSAYFMNEARFKETAETVLKYREDQGRVQENGLDAIVNAALERGSLRG